MTPRKTWTTLLVVSGLFLIFGLDVFLAPPSELSVFDQVERRIPGGAVLGVGLVLHNIRPRSPWLPFLASVLCWLSVGALIGRLIGLAFVLGQSDRQWVWVMVEVVVIGLTGLYLRRTDASKP